MRGKDQRIEGNQNAGGITPAYAGKSLDTDHMVLFLQDHPRLCGEKPCR